MKDCWFWCVALLLRVQVKLDKKDCDGRSVWKDCYCTMIKCLYDFVLPVGTVGRCACARFAVIKYAFSLHCVCNVFAQRVSVHIN